MDLNPTVTWNWIAAICSVFFLISVFSYAKAGLTAGVWTKIVLVLLRTLALGLTLLLLLDPHRVERNSFKEPMEFAVLVDASASMSFNDGREDATRWEEALDFLHSKVRAAIDESCVVRTYTFGAKLDAADNDLLATTPAQPTSDLATALEEVLVDGREVALGGVLVIGDGQVDDKVRTLDVAKKYRRGGIPVYTHCCGKPVEMPDVQLKSVDGGQIIPFEPRVRLVLNVDSPGMEDRETMVTVRCGERLLYERPLQLNGQLTEHTIEFDTPYRGFYPYDVSLAAVDGERLDYNNATQIGLSVTDQKIRVLYMEGTPSSTHTLEDALEADPDIEVVFLIPPDV